MSDIPAEVEHGFCVVALPHRECMEISLVLASQSIGHWIVRAPLGLWEIHADSDDRERITETLSRYREENRPHSLTVPPLYLRWQPFWILLLPALISFAAEALGRNWAHGRGMAEAGRILSGEWWRLFTALTLHADARHLASNLAAGYFILNILAGRIALSRAVPWLVAAAGTANLLVALTVHAEFRSLGFSTFVFAALGMLGALETRLLPRDGILSGLRQLQPLFSAFFVAVMMGLGENSDILAHFYGLFCGVVAGFALPRSNLEAGPVAWGWARALGVWIFFAFCWSLALGSLWRQLFS